MNKNRIVQGLLSGSVLFALVVYLDNRQGSTQSQLKTNLERSDAILKQHNDLAEQLRAQRQLESQSQPR